MAEFGALASIASVGVYTDGRDSDRSAVMSNSYYALSIEQQLAL